MDYDVLRPMYSVYHLKEGTYKIVKFKRSYSSLPHFSEDDEDKCSNENKFSQSISRAKKVIFELAVCNVWDYFFTGTLNPKYDRYDLDSLHNMIREFMKYRFKKYGIKFSYLLVPEQHSDGAWHLHGFVSALPSYQLYRFESGKHPWKLVNSDYVYWKDYNDTFGFCSLSPLRSEIGSAYYCTKYVDKSLAGSAADVGRHLYWASRPLQRAVKAFDYYVDSPALDEFLDREYDFCSTGIVAGLPFHFGSELPQDYIEYNSTDMDVNLYTFDGDQTDDDVDPRHETYEIDEYYSIMQEIIKGWHE